MNKRALILSILITGGIFGLITLFTWLIFLYPVIIIDIILAGVAFGLPCSVVYKCLK